MEQDSNILINNMYIQMEVTATVNAIYNAEHEKAEKDFRWIRYRFPNHPLPYFLYGLNEWWKILPEPQNREYDDRFIAYMDSAIYYAEKIFEEDESNIEAAFFLAAGHAFKGRLYAETGSWTKGAFQAKSALNYLELSKGKKDLSPEFLFGDGLYNYYAEWIPENYPILKPVMRLFDDGDKELGLKQLTTVSRTAFYTRTEAQYFLMRILSIEEDKIYEGLQVSEYLHETFPQNAYFHRFYARLLYSTGKITDAERECLDIMQAIDSAQTGYGPTSGRYAGFFLGQIYERQGKTDEAEHYYKRAVSFSEQAEEEEAGYYLYSLLHLGMIAEKKGNEDQAKDYYKKVKKNAGRDQSVRKKAKEKLKDL
jgi:tetratricopeptide (TPR) repeat protein